MRKRTITVPVLFFLIILFVAVFSLTLPQKTRAAQTIKMDIYVIDLCGGCGNVGVGCKSCTIIDELSNRYRLLFPDDEVEMKFYNLRMDNTLQKDMEERIEALNVDLEMIDLPILFIGDKLFLADGSMDEAVKNFVETGEYPGIETMLREKAEYEAKKDSGKVVYLYSSYCEDCKEISKWLTYSLPEGYELLKYDIYSDEGLEMEKYYREMLEISDEEYCIPLIVYGDYWFAGKDSIYLSLKSRIKEYPDLQTITWEKKEE